MVRKLFSISKKIKKIKTRKDNKVEIKWIITLESYKDCFKFQKLILLLLYIKTEMFRLKFYLSCLALLKSLISL